MTEDTSTDLEALVTYRVLQLSDTITRAAAQVYRDRHGISLTELRAMAIIAAHAPIAANEVSRRTGIDKGWISRSLTTLAENGLVTRSPHPTDSRSALLSLTDKGQALVGRLLPLATARHQYILSDLTPEQRDALYRLLDTMQVRADELLANPEMF